MVKSARETAAEIANSVDCEHFTHANLVHHGDNALSSVSLAKTAVEKQSRKKKEGPSPWCFFECYIS